MDSSSPVSSDGTISAGVEVDYDAAISSLLIANHRQQHQERDDVSRCRIASSPSLAPETENKITADNPMHSQLTQLTTEVPSSLLVKHNNIHSTQHENQQQHPTELLDIVRGILHVAAGNGDQCQQQGNNNDGSFISPMITRPDMFGVDSELRKLSLDENSEEKNQDGEDFKAAAGASLFATTAGAPISAHPAPLPHALLSKTSLYNETSRRKRVHFESLTPSIKYTISRADITQEEKRKFWLQNEEFALIRLRDSYLSGLAEQQQRQNAAAAQSSVILPSLSTSISVSSQHWICTRGLELKMKLRSLRTQSKRLACLEKVLVEQERQWDCWDDGRDGSIFCYDDEAIAAECSEITKDSYIHAQKVAANDRQEVEEEEVRVVRTQPTAIG